jgi:hypothetical protein
MLSLKSLPHLVRHVREEPPSWSWEEHGHQPYQQAEHAEHRFEAVMVVVALMIVAAVGARLIAAYQGLPI